jgi:hypothetical protein
VLNDRLSKQRVPLFKIKLLNKDGAFVEYWLALVLTTISDNSDHLDPFSQFVQVRKALTAGAFEVFSIGNIVGCALIIPKIATSCKAGDRQTEQRIVHSHRDLATWNDVYI